MTSPVRPRPGYPAVACALAIAISCFSLQSQQDERSLRAAYLYSLTKYVVWPVPAQRINLCVLGQGSAASAFKAILDGKSSGEIPIHVQLDPSDLELRHCEIIYFPTPSTSRISSILAKTQGLAALTVGEDETFLSDGGMVAFVRARDTLQIEVNLDSVLAENLKISSRLLDLAIIVHSGRRG